MPWIGVDLDGTLADSREWPMIGRPIPAMVDRVKQWLSEGKDVRIFTARVYPHGRKNPLDYEAVVRNIQRWCFDHIGMALPVTCEKDFQMMELWDDRCIHVEANTGRILG